MATGSIPPPPLASELAAELREYGELAGQLRFASAEQCIDATALRERLLASALGHGAELSCKGSKPHIGALSPGCRACAEGRWSCLFVNGRCNCRCFYCPTAQDDPGEPTTNGLTFTKAAEYASYVEQLDFSGASISGGEPLLSFDKSLNFVTALERRLGDRVHLWLYTNGVLADADKLARLRDAGLDEIRFDIGATNYQLAHLERAIGVIPTVTVEIPAIPEEGARLRETLVSLANMGVDHLNLHQLRLTPFNLPQLVKRPYTFLRGDKITVLESELLALELVAWVAERKLALPVNYCSFVFKHRYQRAAARRRAAARMRKPWEGISEAGYLRTTALLGDVAQLQRASEALQALPEATERWQLLADRLLLDGALLPALVAKGLSGLGLTVAYGEAALRSSLSYRGPFIEVPLGTGHKGGRKVYIERLTRADERSFSGDEIARFTRLLAGEAPDDPSTAEASRFEHVASNLELYR